MSFFDGVDTQNAGSFEFAESAPIPSGTRVLASCESAELREYESDKFISLTWRIHQPAEYANRVVFQKLYLWDAAKERNHKRMLAAIAHNAGNRLIPMMQQSGESEPSVTTLQASITNHPMVLELEVWEMEIKGEQRSGNWVRAVSPRKTGGGEAPQAPAPQAAAPQATAPVADSFDETIPF